jgi:hypothetical protein
MIRLAIITACIFACGLQLPAQSNSPANGQPPAPAAGSAAALPHDDHGGMRVTVDPYTVQERCKEKFGKANPLPAGILAVEVTLQNETSHPIHINLTTIQLEVQIRDERQDVDWLTPVEVANAIVHPDGPPAPRQRRVPVVGIPLPSKDKKVEKLADELRPLTLDADVIPPMAAIHGFLFFNMSHELSLVPDSSFYLPDASFLPSNEPLMFFEIPLGAGPSL